MTKGSIPSRRFGRTEIQIPVLSLGGMRFQQSWTDLGIKDIPISNQVNLEKILHEAVNNGLHHLETARHYGTSELQIGLSISNVNDPKRILQTKVPPRDDPKDFEQELELSFKRLQCKRVDLLAIHGINLPEHLEQTIRPGGCIDIVRRWQKKGLIGHVGFSTHGSNDLIVQAIETNEFDYVNLHWYFIYQDNSPALDAAAKLDLGVFIISPTDKGGHLHTPSSKLVELCAPLHPIAFNDLFCLTDKRVHTISVGAANPGNFERHIEALRLLNNSGELLSTIQERLLDASRSSLGDEWLSTWRVGLPRWDQTPGGINIPVLLWLHTLIESWEMEDFAKSRYRLLGKASHWFPGSNADCFDDDVSEDDLREVLLESPWCDEIPFLLRQLKTRLAGEPSQRLSSI
ncbi:aldo/keto reductase [Prochlorococcus marinus]|uniref:Aldo/keto reductase family n=1 Tax=Prochlorococcus marinus (strain MIT 9211) TaxID=93059 RepID=A9BCG5_PROM4|nr:aldo/keto reductase [Prochlorococcus marinus]ABX09527.1 Aldo/keto reductase family [Prochlorococcus marinus str. MIT 9211]